MTISLSFFTMNLNLFSNLTVGNAENTVEVTHSNEPTKSSIEENTYRSSSGSNVTQLRSWRPSLMEVS